MGPIVQTCTENRVHGLWVVLGEAKMRKEIGSKGSVLPFDLHRPTTSPSSIVSLVIISISDRQRRIANRFRGRREVPFLHFEFCVFKMPFSPRNVWVAFLAKNNLRRNFGKYEIIASIKIKDQHNKWILTPQEIGSATSNCAHRTEWQGRIIWRKSRWTPSGRSVKAIRINRRHMGIFYGPIFGFIGKG